MVALTISMPVQRMLSNHLPKTTVINMKKIALLIFLFSTVVKAQDYDIYIFISIRMNSLVDGNQVLYIQLESTFQSHQSFVAMIALFTPIEYHKE